MHTQLIDISPLSLERHLAWPVPQESQLGIHCAVKKLSHQLLIDNDAHEYDDDDTILPTRGQKRYRTILIRNSQPKNISPINDFIASFNALICTFS